MAIMPFNKCQNASHVETYRAIGIIKVSQRVIVFMPRDVQNRKQFDASAYRESNKYKKPREHDVCFFL